jgi:hypothetical protein
MDVEELGWEIMDWTELIRDRDKWRWVVVSTVTDTSSSKGLEVLA